MTHPTQIPFLDLTSEIEQIRPEIDQAIARVLDSGEFIFGPELSSFETEFATYNGMAHAIGVSSGLTALKLMLQACGVGPGDEVIVPANTFIGTWLAVSAVGAIPVSVEPAFDTRNLDATRIPEAITSKTRAVLAVHLYGAPCDMDVLRQICHTHQLLLLIDAAQACGAEWRDSRAACLGDAAAFSFYPTKNLGALGDAGAVVTDSAEVAERIRQLRNYGMTNRYKHDLKGENGRLEELHAAVLRVKLRHLDMNNRKRAELAAHYLETFADRAELGVQRVPSHGLSAWHLFTLAVANRDQVVDKLKKSGIGTLVHYPVPPHLSEAYRAEMRKPNVMPVTEKLSDTILSLPLHPLLDENSVRRVANVLGEAIR
ncbi:MAG: erythromycin biosynthesis sensory transduction protein eryC1 [Deltaproteobacteria bacterium]|nr:MAG: erythromycin biosynthesis sensory transduction protein eryC1 [Deltaproteobacteria bacterium]